MNKRRGSLPQTQLTLADYRDALGAIDPNCARDTWVEVGMAARDAGLAVDDFIAWSRDGDNFDGDKDCRQVWSSFTKGGVTASTLLHHALQAGWTFPTGDDADRRYKHPARGVRSERHSILPAQAEPPPATRRDPQAEIEEAKAREKMAAILAIATPASDDHPYLVRKQIEATGLLQAPRKAVIDLLGYSPKLKRGELAGDTLLIAPLHLGDGVPSALEMIDQDGRKAGLYGLPRAGAMWGCEAVIARAGAEGAAPLRIGIAEGIATAKTVAASYPLPTVAAGSSGNFRNVIELLRERFPTTELLLFADLGKPLAATEALAREHFLTCYAPDPTAMPEDKTDFNDMLAATSVERLYQWFVDHDDNAAPRGQVISWRGAARHIDIDFVLPGLPAGSVGMIIGPGAVGKTFFSLDLCIAVALGRSPSGLPGGFGTPAIGRSAIVLGEDPPDITSNRMHDMIAAHAIADDDIDRLDARMRVLSMVGEDIRLVEVLHGEMAAGPFADGLRRLCHGRRLVILDPLARLHDGEENDNSGATRLMLLLSRIALDTRCAIILLHHVGKGSGEGWKASRGASAFTMSARWQVNLAPPTAAELEANQALQQLGESRTVKLEVVKSNYGPRPEPMWLVRGAKGVLSFIDVDPYSNPFSDPPMTAAAKPAASTPTRGQKPRGLVSPPRSRLVDDD